jgi:hypothetical protein
MQLSAKPKRLTIRYLLEQAAARLHARLFHFCLKLGALAALAGTNVPKDE